MRQRTYWSLGQHFMLSLFIATAFMVVVLVGSWELQNNRVVPSHDVPTCDTYDRGDYLGCEITQGD